MSERSSEPKYVYDVIAVIGSPPTLPEQASSFEANYIPLEAEEGKKEEPKRDEGTSNAKIRSTSSRRAAFKGPVKLPWADACAQIQSPSLRIHKEIQELCKSLSPSKNEDNARRAAIQRVRNIIVEIFPQATVDVFGSFATGLYLPTSDIDLVVNNSQCTNKVFALRAISRSLSSEGMAQNIQVISAAKVPIVKFDDKESGLAFDVSLDSANGPQTASYVLDLMEDLPQMRPLVVVLKLFLQQRELNEVYQGGIGSYALLVMVAAFLKMHPSRFKAANSHSPPKLETNLGLLLIDFFDLYGRLLNYNEVGISCRGSGGFFYKRASGRSYNFYQRDRSYMLAVEDPQDTTNDLGKGSFGIMKAKRAFEFAYDSLVKPAHREDSLLRRILRLDAVVLIRNSELRGGPVSVVEPLEPSGSDMSLDSSVAQEMHRRAKKHHEKATKRHRSEHTLKRLQAKGKVKKPVPKLTKKGRHKEFHEKKPKTKPKREKDEKYA